MFFMLSEVKELKKLLKKKNPKSTPYLALERRSTTEKHTKYTNVTLQIRFYPIPNKGMVSVPQDQDERGKTAIQN